MSYLKGIEKILENRSVFQNALQLEQCQGNPARERDGRASGQLHFESRRKTYSYFDFGLKNSSFRLPLGNLFVL